MLEQQQKLIFSSYSELYELIIPKDNILRRIHQLIDFSFIYDELSSKYCHDNGRTAESPIRLFKYLLLKVIYNISDVDVVDRSRVDMSFNYLQIVSKLNPAITQGFRKEEDKFEFNKDAGMFVCPAGHMAVRKARQGAKNKNTNQVIAYYFNVEKCKVCAQRDGCYKEGAQSKSYSVTINSKEHEEQIEFQNSDYFKEKSQHRYKIEAKNGELKNTHGFDRAISYGLDSMQMQTALTIFAVNLKRILKLM